MLAVNAYMEKSKIISAAKGTASGIKPGTSRDLLLCFPDWANLANANWVTFDGKTGMTANIVAASL